MSPPEGASVERGRPPSPLPPPVLVASPHAAVVRSGEAVRFLVRPQNGSERNLTSIRVRYSESSESVVETLDDELSWFHVFYAAGLYRIRVDSQGVGEPIVIVVQHPITRLKLLGPSRVAASLSRSGNCGNKNASVNCRFSWTANCDGSDLLYKWTTEDGIYYTTNANSLAHNFHKPGNYVLSVEVSNGLGKLHKSKLIKVHSPLEKIKMKNDVTEQDNATLMTITIYGNEYFKLSIDFGDQNTLSLNHKTMHDSYYNKRGTSLQLKSKMEMILSNNTDDMSTKIIKHKQSPCDNLPRKFFLHDLQDQTTDIYFIEICHMFSSAGVYLVKVNISDDFINLNEAAMVVVYRSSNMIYEIWRSSQINETVPIWENVGFEIYINEQSFCDLTWNFGDGCMKSVTSLNRNNICKISHVFTNPGNYSVTVKSNNPKFTLTSLNEPVIVMDGIANFSLKHIIDNHYEPMTCFSLETINDQEILQKKDVMFEARFRSGSHITYIIDYGDGITDKKYISSNEKFVQLHHVYTSDGKFNITATAYNLLSTKEESLRMPLIFKIFPSMIGFHDNMVVAIIGKKITIEVDAKGGSENISYNWWFSERLIALAATSNISMIFNETGIFTVTVKLHDDDEECSSKIFHLQDTLLVHVQDILQGVQLQIFDTNDENSSANIFIINDCVNLRAKILPNGNIVDFYIWRMGTDIAQTLVPDLTYCLQERGKLNFNVEAVNRFSSVISNTIQIIVIGQLAQLKSIQHPSSTRVDHSVKFLIQFWFEFNACELHWDFGDGQMQLITSLPYAQHKYLETGVYKIQVMVSNKLQSVNITSQIFVLETEICYPPTITFPENHQYEHMNCMTAIYIEPQIEVFCEEMIPTPQFEWKIFNMNNSVVMLDKHIISSRNLYLSNHFLSPGTYNIKLKVFIVGTILFAEEHMNLTVAECPLTVEIEGGMSRTICRHSKLLLQSKISESKNSFYGFHWQCQTVSYHPLPCFNTNVPDIYESVLTFPGDWLTSRANFFFFNVTVNDESEIANGFQIVHLVPCDEESRVELTCPKASEVSETSYMEFSVECKNCGNSEMEVFWQLFVVADGSHTIQNRGYHCGWDIQAISFLNASLNLSFLLPKTKHNFSAAQHLHKTNRIEHYVNENSLTFYEDNMALNSETSLDFDKSNKLENDEQKHNLSFHQSLETLEEGFPGDLGSIPARDHNHIIEEINLQVKNGNVDLSSEFFPWQIGLFPNKTMGNNDEHVMQTQLKFSKIDHVFFQLKSPVELNNKSNFETGNNFRHLVLKPGVLSAGATHVMSAIVKRKDLEWTASCYMKVPRGPENGRCSLMPSEGNELTTNFRLTCMDWTSKSPPNFYQLTYSLNESFLVHIVYHGIQKTVAFVLPAGLRTNDYKVNLKVKLFDSAGISTEVCDISVKVNPGVNIKMKKLIYDELFLNSSTVSQLVAEKTGQKLINRLKTLVTILNRKFNNVSLVERQKLIYKIIEKMQYVEILSFVETVQMFSVFYSMLINVSVIDYPILKEMVSFSEKLLQNLDKPFSSMLFESNIVAVITESLLKITKSILSQLLVQSSPNFGLKRIYEQTLDLINAFFEWQCQNKHYKSDLYFVSEDSSVCLNCPCVCKHKLNLRDNLNYTNHQLCCQQYCINYFDFANGTNSVQTDEHLHFFIFLSFNHKTMNCNMATIDFKHFRPYLDRKKRENYFNGHLKQSEIELHKFFVDDHIKYSSLLIRFNVDNSSTVGGGSVKIVISYKNPPTANNVFYQTNINFSSPSITLYLQRDKFLENGDYYIGIFEVPEDKQISSTGFYPEKKFELDVWWVDCLSWNWKSYSLVNKTCSIFVISESNEIQCKCQPGNLHGVRTLQVKYDTTRIPVYQFYRTRNNNSTILAAMIALLAFVFFVCASVCRITNAVDRYKCKISFSNDNSSLHSQLYMVVMSTGFHQGSGTTSSVYLTLHGAKGMSETAEMKMSPSFHPFQRSSQDTFLITTSSNLGPVWKVHLWHNNSGNSPSWFLRNILVKDVNLGDEYFFNCNKWFAVEECDGNIEREILQTETKWSFLKIFIQLFPQCLVDHHLWYSTYNHSAVSGFERSERFLCCTLAMLSYIAIGTFWFSNNSTLEQISSISFRWEIVYNGFLICILMEPLMLIMCSIFRRNRNLKNSWCQSDIVFEDALQFSLRQKIFSSNFKFVIKPAIRKLIAWVSWSLLMLASVIILATCNLNYFTSTFWLINSFAAFLLSFFIIQPLEVVVVTFFLAWRSEGNVIKCSIYKDYDAVAQTAWLHFNRLKTQCLKLDDGTEEEHIQLRCRSRYLRSIRPPTEYFLIAARHRMFRERAVGSFLSAIVKYGIQLILLLIITLEPCQQDIVLNNKALNRTILSSPSNFTFHSIKTKDDWWKWMLVNGLNSSVSVFSQQHSEHFMIGTAQLKKFEFEDNLRPDTQTFNTNCRNDVCLKLNTNLSLNQVVYINLNSHKEELEIILKNLLSSKWITTNTISVNLEYHLYNPALKILSAVHLEANFQLINHGDVGLNVGIISIFRDFHVSQYERITIVAKLILITILVWDFVLSFQSQPFGNSSSIIRKILKKLCIITCLVYIGLQLNNKHSSFDLINDMKKQMDNKFLNLRDYIEHHHKVQQFGYVICLVALLHFLSWLSRLSYFIKFWQTAAIVLKFVPYLMVYLAIVIFTSGIFGHCVFGSHVKEFSTFSKTLMLLLENLFALKEKKQQSFDNFIKSYFMLLTFVVVMSVVCWVKVILNSKQQCFHSASFMWQDLRNFLCHLFQTSFNFKTNTVYPDAENFLIEFHLQELDELTEKLLRQIKRLDIESEDNDEDKNLLNSKFIEDNFEGMDNEAYYENGTSITSQVDIYGSEISTCSGEFSSSLCLDHFENSDTDCDSNGQSCMPTCVKAQIERVVSIESSEFDDLMSNTSKMDQKDSCLHLNDMNNLEVKEDSKGKLLKTEDSYKISNLFSNDTYVKGLWNSHNRKFDFVNLRTWKSLTILRTKRISFKSKTSSSLVLSASRHIKRPRSSTSSFDQTKNPKIMTCSSGWGMMLKEHTSPRMLMKGHALPSPSLSDFSKWEIRKKTLRRTKSQGRGKGAMYQVHLFN